MYPYGLAGREGGIGRWGSEKGRKEGRKGVYISLREYPSMWWQCCVVIYY